MRTSHSTAKLTNKHFISQQNLAINRLISQIDLPEDEIQSSNPTPPLIMQPPQKNNPSDSLSLLINKAQNAVKKGSLKIQKNKNIRNSVAQFNKQQQDLAFLTGVQINEPQPKQQQQIEHSQALDQQILSILRKKTMKDDLQELRRQIKLTNGQLKSYQRQVKGTQKQVYSLAGRYNSYFNLKIPVKSPTVDFSGLSYFQLKNFKKYVRKQQ